MADWVSKKLKDLTTKIGSGATPRGGSNVYASTGIALIRSQNVLDNVMKTFDIAHISDDAANTLAGVTVERGDVLINITGDSIARCAMVEPTLLPARVNQHVAILRTGSELDSRFLQRFLVNPSFKHDLIANSSGGTRNALTKAGLGELVITFPPLEEQQAIAEVLGALDDKIVANSKLVRTADELAGSLTRHLLDFENLVPLSSVAIMTMGSSPLGATLNEEKHGDVFYQGVRDFGVRFPTNRVWTTGPVRFAEPFDTLLSVRAPVGRVNLARERACIGRGIASVKSRIGHPYSNFHVLRNDLETWAPYEAEGTVFGSINKSQLESLAMPSIPSEKADELEQKLESLEHRIASALDENLALAATRDALLPQLMSGAFRVKDAEKVLEEVV